MGAFFTDVQRYSRAGKAKPGWFRLPVALLESSNADAFLGTQGDPWDTQSDMFCALIGAAAAQLSVARLHDR